jgi:hypothetical protein
MLASAPLGLDLAAALDPALFAQHAAGFALDSWQTDVLRSPAKRKLLNCSRQAGKSSVVAALALHTALFEPGSLTLLLSPSERQSGELAHTIWSYYRRLGRPVPPNTENTLTLELATGSRIKALPSKEANIRGFPRVRLLVIDEAAWVPDELYYSVLPMLAVSGGNVVVLSTPCGKRGFFHKEWTEGGGDWERVEIPATMCPRINPTFLKEQRRRMPAFRYQSEYECAFTETLDQMYSYEIVQRAFENDLTPLFAPIPTPTAPANTRALTPLFS